MVLSIGQNTLLENRQSYHVLFVLTVVCTFIFVALMMYIPETPTHLILTLSNIDAGKICLEVLRGKEELETVVGLFTMPH